MSQYKASIVYHADNMRRLAACIHATFHMKLRVVYLAFCLGLLAAGAIIGIGTIPGLTCICFGAFLLPSVKAVEKNRCNEAIRQLKGAEPHVEYAFAPGTFTCSCGNEKSSCSFRAIIRLVDEKEYLYLFPNRTQAYMIDKATISPKGEEAFKAFIACQVGLEWTKPVSLMSFTLKKWKYNKENTRLS